MRRRKQVRPGCDGGRESTPARPAPRASAQPKGKRVTLPKGPNSRRPIADFPNRATLSPRRSPRSRHTTGLPDRGRAVSGGGTGDAIGSRCVREPTQASGAPLSTNRSIQALALRRPRRRDGPGIVRARPRPGVTTPNETRRGDGEPARQNDHRVPKQRARPTAATGKAVRGRSRCRLRPTKGDNSDKECELCRERGLVSIQEMPSRLRDTSAPKPETGSETGRERAAHATALPDQRPRRVARE